jgi:dTDP-4-dehydrorhamnose reductase
VPDLVNTVLELLLDDEFGIWHISNQSAVSWSELAYLGADMAKLQPMILTPNGSRTRPAGQAACSGCNGQRTHHLASFAR